MIDVEVLQSAPGARPKPVADPATTSALPTPDVAPHGEAEAAKPALAQPSPSEVPPDDMPQQVAAPDIPARIGIDALTPEPLAPTMVMAPALAPSAPEEVRQVQLVSDPATTSSVVPVETSPESEELGEAAEIPSTAPAPAMSEKPEPEPKSQPEVARADPKEETPVQASPAEGFTEAETPPAPLARNSRYSHGS